MTQTTEAGCLTWLHIGDLHIKEPDGENLRDLHRIVDYAGSLPQGSLDFVLLPGDNADDGTAEQYRMAKAAIDELRLPVHILTGDHDFVPKSLDNFHGTFGARKLPYAETVHGARCLFLDVVSAGTGGPDFRLGADQLDWAEREVEQAAAANQPVAIFMHTYPADLRQGADRIGALLGQPHVACVDMGHTHYNELANDGGTIFMATRSTGQIEEGPAGFSIATLDGGCVGWRFKSLDRPFPFVLITRPADARLHTALSRGTDPTLVRARVLGDHPMATVTVQADGGKAQPMAQVHGEPFMWEARLPAAPASIVVRATDQAGQTDHDRIDPAPSGYQPPSRTADGSDKDSVGAWPEKGIPGGQLGPNRNGRKW